MTLTEFLNWEEHQPPRYEWDGVQATAMTGGSLSRSSIKVNLIAEVGNRLRGKSCRLFDSHAKIIVDSHVRYPAASITCTQQVEENYARQGVVERPVIVFGVLSDSTATGDRIDKNQEYRATPSIRRYVMLERDRVAATVFSRSGGAWNGELLLGPDAALTLPEADIAEIRLANLHEGVVF